MRALSLRQPFAWLVVHGGKRIENRLWHLPTRMVGVPFLIHAAKGMTKDEYREGSLMAAEIGVAVPPREKLLFGGIVGRGNRMTRKDQGGGDKDGSCNGGKRHGSDSSISADVSPPDVSRELTGGSRLVRSSLAGRVEVRRGFP